MKRAGYIPINGGTTLPIARLGRLEAGWFVEGDGWTMTPRGNLSVSEAKAICVASAAAVRALGPCLAGGGHDSDAGT